MADADATTTAAATMPAPVTPSVAERLGAGTVGGFKLREAFGILYPALLVD